MTEKSKLLIENTYRSLADRIREDGYAPTSVTGAYGGMYGRDASVHALCHTLAGDFDLARKIMEYTVDYHNQHGFDYLIHVLDPAHNNPCLKCQADATFFFLHTWVTFANTAPKTDENKAFLQNSYERVKILAHYFLQNGDFDNPYGLLFNQSLEHTRDRSYFQCYDLLTNVYASQALHELAQLVAEADPENATVWESAAAKIVKGVHNFLVGEVDGKKIYAELIGRSQKSIDANPNAARRDIRGFSWVNLAPMSCDWYAADPEILENTYQAYLKYGCVEYYGKHQMLDSFTAFETELAPATKGTHVLGKGLAWEMMYCKKMGYTDRLQELTVFLEDCCDQVVRESWLPEGGGSDTGNQEHAGWLLIAYQTIKEA